MSLSVTLDITEISQHISANNSDIRSYLDSMMLEYETGSDQCMFLPSLISLSECFKCSPVEVHQALTALKERDCDFFIMGFESPITLWYPSRLTLKKYG
jgi:hypothetical protein